MDYLFFDWAAMATTFLAVYMLGNHSRSGFVVFMISNLCWMATGYLAESQAMIWGNAIFLVVNLRGWLKWGRDEATDSAAVTGQS
ncbi:MAG: PnuC protein [Thermoanaerobaculia bacterium]|nr:PnuC protein [Thermoanaerobaculia bacterium]